MATTWEDGAVMLVAEIEEIDVESGASAAEPAVRRTIWVVVVDGVVYVRSVTGVGGLWYQAVLARPDGLIHAGDVTLPMHASHVTDPDVIAQVSAEYLRKYAGSEWAPPMAEPKTLPATLRLDPRP